MDCSRSLLALFVLLVFSGCQSPSSDHLRRQVPLTGTWHWMGGTTGLDMGPVTQKSGTTNITITRQLAWAGFGPHPAWESLTEAAAKKVDGNSSPIDPDPCSKPGAKLFWVYAKLEGTIGGKGWYQYSAYEWQVPTKYPSADEPGPEVEFFEVKSFIEP